MKSTIGHATVRFLTLSRGVGMIHALCFSLLTSSFALGQRVGEFKVPELDEQGNLKSMMIGKEARMSPGKPMEITGLTVEFYDADKQVNMRIQSPQCNYHDRTGLATSDREVHIEGQGFTIDGVGFEYHIKDERLQIFSNAKVVLRNLSTQDQPESTPPESSTP